MSINTNEVRAALGYGGRQRRVGQYSGIIRPLTPATPRYKCGVCGGVIPRHNLISHVQLHDAEARFERTLELPMLQSGIKEMGVPAPPSTPNNVTHFSDFVAPSIIPRFAVAALIRTPVGVALWPVLDTTTSKVDGRRWVSVNISTQPGKVMPKWYLEAELIELNPAVVEIREAA